MSGKFAGGVSRRRDEMYGNTKFDRFREMKNSLTTDHLSMLQEEGRKLNLPPWESTTKTTFIGRQPANGVSKDTALQKERQRASHFTMRADGSKIDDAIYKSSIALKDYDKKNADVIPALKPDRTIYLADMQPRFWTDNRFGTSMYRTEFSDMAKEGAQTQQMRDIKREQNEICRHNLKDVRKSHFNLGNNPGSFDSETYYSYHMVKPGATTGSKADASPAMLARRMVEDERNSAVFRQGDYNVANVLPSISTFNRDFNTTIKPLKAAGFIEPTKSKKGRFLDRAPRQERNEVFSENNRDNGPSTVEHSYKKREAVCSTLKQLFMQYDTTKNGYISKEVLRRACNCLLDPIPDTDLDEILKATKRGMTGTIDYTHFIQQYMSHGESRLEPETLKAAPSSNEKVNFDDIPGLEGKDAAVTACWPPKTTAGNPLLITSELGKEYQTTAHFKFGNDGENPASIYHKDYDMKGYKETHGRVHVKAPRSSEVMHKSANSEFGKSTKQMDYINFKNMSQDQFQKSLDVRDTMAKKNKLRHSKNSVHLTCDDQRHSEDRQASIARSSFVNHETAVVPVPFTAERPKYRYLDTEAALPYMANTPSQSEATEAFSNLTSPGECLTNLAQVKKENNARVKEQKKVHFKFGSDEPSKVSEAQDEYIQCRAVGDEIPSAGRKNMHDPKFNHMTASKNTQDLKNNPMSWNSFDTLRMNKKGYFSGQSAPANPLHLSLESVFSKLDPDSTGKVAKEQMKEVCSNYKISISYNAMEALLKKCDRYEDGNVNYHAFLNNMTLQQIPEGISTAHTGSTMSNDYRPLQQRSFTQAQIRTIDHMNRKPILPQQSHLFHVDENRGNNFVSTMNQDFIQPEIQPRTWIPSDAC